LETVYHAFPLLSGSPVGPAQLGRWELLGCALSLLSVARPCREVLTALT
jgi:hypothetical protein